VNALNQYSAVAAMTPIYDGNGNLTFDGTFTYGYDAENRLTSASGPGVAASYAYDPQGRRKSKTVNGALADTLIPSANNGELKTLLQTGLKLFREHQHHAEHLAANLR